MRNNYHLSSESEKINYSIKVKSLFLILFCSLLFGVKFFVSDFAPNSKNIAKIIINDVIEDNISRDDKIKTIIDNDQYVALLVHIDSPGGSPTAGESLYGIFKKISEKKPVVITMGSQAASAAYMISLAGDYVVAYNTTITGSVGARHVFLGFSNLLAKLGLEAEVTRSGEFKAAPTMYESISDKWKLLIQKSVDDVFAHFLSMVIENRHLSESIIEDISTGRIVLGKEAVSMGLIDDVGNEDTVLAWLSNNKGISNVPIKTLDVNKNKISIVDAISSLHFVNKMLYKVRDVVGIVL